jgi:hypothetical protein
MKLAVSEYMSSIQLAAEAGMEACRHDDEQQALKLANDIRNLAWAIKEEIFKTRLLDDKITKKNPPRAIKLMAQARHVSTSLDDILDLL